MSGPVQRLAELFRRFRRDDRGVFMIVFAVLAIVLVATSGAVVDFTRMQQARTRAQTALDAATLALQSRVYSNESEAVLKARVQDILTQRIADPSIEATIVSATKQESAGRLTIEAYIVVPTAFVQLVGIQSIRANLVSEATRGSTDLEVSVSLDVTGSMAATYDRWGRLTSNKIGDLVTATNSLIDLLVKDQQPPAAPTYTKMAIVPWSAGVNIGAYAASVRGTPNTTTRNITAASWQSGSTLDISRQISRGSPTTIKTTSNHGLSTGDTVYLEGISGLTRYGSSLNGAAYVVTRKDADEFTIAVNTSSYSSHVSGSGTVRKCQVANCELVVTSSNHGYSNGDPIRIEGATWLTNKGFFANNVTGSTMSLVNSFGPSEGSYRSGAKIWCADYGCSYRTFYSAVGGINSLPVSTCVSDRPTSPSTDTAPSIIKLGYNYPSSNGCIGDVIVPLTSDKTALRAVTNSLSAQGSTAGHLGLAWGWYMISPNFAYLWPSASQPRAYGANNLIKAVVFMTDGQFNTPYCSGVIAADAASGSGSAGDHIDCASPNGSSRQQAEALCNAIKAPANHTLLYTVGFDLGGDADSLDFLRNCATDGKYFFQADNGADLTAAFQSIASSLSELRISR